MSSFIKTNLHSKFIANAKVLMKKYDCLQIKNTWIDLISNILNNNISSLKSDFTSSACEYELFSIEKLLSMQNINTKFEYRNFAEKLFSLKNYYSNSGKKKILTIIGIKITFKKKIKGKN